MRILYFSDNHSDHNRRFLEKLAEVGNEVYFLDATQEGSVETWLPCGVRQAQPKQIVQRHADPRDFAEFLVEFQLWVKELRPDIVHAGPIQTCGYVATLSGFHPLVLMSWGSDLLLHAHRNAEWRRATEIALEAADGFFCDCDAVREATQRYVTIPTARIVQFPWGLRRGAFAPQGPAKPREKLGWSSDAFIFICTRSWEPLYDIDVLLRAFQLAFAKNHRLRLLLLGDGSEADRVRRFIGEHDLKQVVATPGLIAGAETPRWFRTANAYVSCAKTDGTSISLLEAMATGLPAVVTDIPSNREWIAEDKNGWLAPAGSSEQFAAKLLRAASTSPHDLAMISEHNQTAVTKRADWDRNFPSLLRLYESLVGNAMVMRA